MADSAVWPPESFRECQQRASCNVVRGTDLFRVQITLRDARHVFRKCERSHMKGNCALHDSLKFILRMARTELPGMAMHREGHNNCRG